MLNKDGKPISLVTTSPEKLVETGDITYIFNILVMDLTNM